MALRIGDPRPHGPRARASDASRARSPTSTTWTPSRPRTSRSRRCSVRTCREQRPVPRTELVATAEPGPGGSRCARGHRGDDPVAAAEAPRPLRHPTSGLGRGRTRYRRTVAALDDPRAERAGSRHAPRNLGAPVDRDHARGHLHDRRGRVWLRDEPGYPILDPVPEPPPVLIAEGERADALDAPRVAIVGTTRPRLMASPTPMSSRSRSRRRGSP